MTENAPVIAPKSFSASPLLPSLRHGLSFPWGFNSEGSCPLPLRALGFFFRLFSLARAITARWDAAFALRRLQLPAVPGGGTRRGQTPEATHSSLRWPPGEVQRRARAVGLEVPWPCRPAAAAVEISP